MNEKIDFIITWVDGSDKEWQKQKNKYKNDKKAEANSTVLYRDYDSLKYLFRSIEKYAPWVNNIFLVTSNQIPKWLDVKNPKVKIIDHKDYIPKEYLPTFSSHVIELNFHRIKELSDKFVYFNDDTILTRYCKQSVFFKNGVPCDSAIINAPVPDYNDFFYCIMNSNTAVINKYYNKNEVIKKNFSKWINIKYGLDGIRTFLLFPWHNFLGLKASHMPSSLEKNTYYTLWDKEFDVLDRTCKNKFRTPSDVNQYVLKNWQIVTGNFSPRVTRIHKMFSMDKLPKNLAKYIKRKRYKMVCINDEKMTDKEYLKVSKYVKEELEKMFPDKSKFEL